MKTSGGTHQPENQTANDTVRKVQMRRDVLVTKRMAVVVVVTFMLQSLPMTLNMFLSSSLFYDINPYLTLMFAATVQVNVFVYILCIPDLRKAFLNTGNQICGCIFPCHQHHPNNVVPVG